MKVQFRKDEVSKQWLVDTIAENGQMLSDKVEIKGTRVLYPESIASGYSSHHKLDDDIDLITYDLSFNTPISLDRIGTEKTDFFVMHIDCSSLDIPILKGNRSNSGGPLNSVVYWTISDLDTRIAIKRGERISGMVVYISKKFMQNLFNHQTFTTIDTEEKSLTADSRDLHYEIEKNNFKILNDQKELFSFPFSSVVGKLQYELVQEILNLEQQLSIYDTLLLKANIIKILGLYIKRVLGSNKIIEESAGFNDASKIFEVKKLIDDNAGSENLSLDDLAKTAAMSKTKLKKRFKEIMGTTAYQYYLDVKMEKAKSILEDCSIPITDLAYELGYKSTSHFSQAFKKHFGVTPTSVAFKSQVY